MALAPVRTEGNDYTGQQPAQWHQPLRIQKTDETRPMGKVKLVSHIPLENTIDAQNATRFEWWRRGFDNMEATITDIFNGPALTNATSTGSTADQVKNLQMAENDAKLYQEDELIEITSKDSNVYGRLQAKVVSKTLNGASSYVTVKLQEADTNNILNDTTLLASPGGPRNGPELREAGSARQNQFALYYNYCQDWDYAVQATDRQLKEKRFLDSRDPWAHYILDEREKFYMQREAMYLKGIRKADADGAYTTGGLRYWLDPANGGTASGRNLVNYKTDSTYLGSETGDVRTLGWEFFKRWAEYAKKYAGPGILKCYTSSTVMTDIQTILEDISLANRNVQDSQDEFGWYYTKVNCAGIQFQFYDHEIFSTSSSYDRTIVAVRPNYLSRVIYSPEKFEEIDTSGTTYKKGWWRGCEGVKVDNPDAHFIIDGFGLTR